MPIYKYEDFTKQSSEVFEMFNCKDYTKEFHDKVLTPNFIKELSKVKKSQDVLLKVLHRIDEEMELTNVNEIVAMTFFVGANLRKLVDMLKEEKRNSKIERMLDHSDDDED